MVFARVAVRSGLNRFLCLVLGHRPKTFEWFRIWKPGYMRGVDTFCQRCGKLLERDINVDNKEK